MRKPYGLGQNISNSKGVTPTKDESSGPGTVNGIIDNADSVNVRRRPSMTASVVEVLRKGDHVKILDEDKNFYKVFTPHNLSGYIVSNYVKEVS